jgi:hypothetical protein
LESRARFTGFLTQGTIACTVGVLATAAPTANAQDYQGKLTAAMYTADHVTTDINVNPRRFV